MIVIELEKQTSGTDESLESDPLTHRTLTKCRGGIVGQGTKLH